MRKEAAARIKINKLLENAGWRFFDDARGDANIQLESGVKISPQNADALGDDFEHSEKGFIDYLLLGARGFPLAVLEAKGEQKSPLDGKEQARRYAKGKGARFVVLSNGDSHYFWDLERGNPEVIVEFPAQESLQRRADFTSDNRRLADELVDCDYIARSQNPRFLDNPDYQNENTRARYLADNDLRILRDYQVRAIHALQKSAAAGKDRFLFEMATGAGKTLVSAAVIKLFLQTGNANRVLFLVDRLELENQAKRNFERYLQNDYITMVYKHNRDDWKTAKIVVSTVQSFSRFEKYKTIFSPGDFDLIIADESHRAINGNARAVFEYFIGYKLGLTATPKDYLRNAAVFSEKDPRAWERRQLLDTYKTFGCEDGEPTYRYGLADGANGGFLVNPTVVDARTDITAELLSKEGFEVTVEYEDGVAKEMKFRREDFEKKLFSEKTNRAVCRAFLENALLDPISKEIGKSIVFCVSQKHAQKIAQILNQMATAKWPQKYQSDFAVQVTSNVDGSQQFAARFANNNLNGRTAFLPEYESSKTRVCTTVGMMTTGYDCEDILNLALLRPIFSPTDFVQMKGRGTRKFSFAYTAENGEKTAAEKTTYKLFDFFANCEYFEKDFNYDAVLELPAMESDGDGGDGVARGIVEIDAPDKIQTITETVVGDAGMRVDREFFHRATETVGQDDVVKSAVLDGQWDRAVGVVREKYENKPKLFLTLEKIRRSVNLDRRLSWREFLERVFGFIAGFKTKDEKLEEECKNFIAVCKPDSGRIPLVKNFLKAYIINDEIRAIIERGEFAKLNMHPEFTMAEYQSLSDDLRRAVPEYVRYNIALNDYMD